MCFAVNQENKKAIEKQLEFWSHRELVILGWAPRRWMDAFSHPVLPLVLQDHSVAGATWGLVPGWVKDDAQAKELADLTLNARIETLYELPSFRASAPGRRCLVPVNGFFEYQHREGGRVKVPHRLTVAGREVFYLGGLWSERHGQKTFTVCTKPANTLMAQVHNSRLRMPVIVPEASAEAWLAGGPAEGLAPFREPRDDDGLVAEVTRGKPRKGEEDQEDLF